MSTLTTFRTATITSISPTTLKTTDLTEIEHETRPKYVKYSAVINLELPFKVQINFNLHHSHVPFFRGIYITEWFAPKYGASHGGSSS